MAYATLYYTKRFESGILKGLSVNCHIDCVDDEAVRYYASKVHKGARGRDVITGSKHVITDASFQNYVR